MAMYLAHFKVSMGSCSVEAGTASVVLDLEEVCGPGEEEAHHPHVASEARQVEGSVTRGGARRLDIHCRLVKNSSYDILRARI